MGQFLRSISPIHPTFWSTHVFNLWAIPLNPWSHWSHNVQSCEWNSSPFLILTMILRVLLMPHICGTGGQYPDVCGDGECSHVQLPLCPGSAGGSCSPPARHVLPPRRPPHLPHWRRLQGPQSPPCLSSSTSWPMSSCKYKFLFINLLVGALNAAGGNGIFCNP